MGARDGTTTARCVISSPGARARDRLDCHGTTCTAASRFAHAFCARTARSDDDTGTMSMSAASPARAEHPEWSNASPVSQPVVLEQNAMIDSYLSRYFSDGPILPPHPMPLLPARTRRSPGQLEYSTHDGESRGLLGTCVLAMSLTSCTNTADQSATLFAS